MNSEKNVPATAEEKKYLLPGCILNITDGPLLADFIEAAKEGILDSGDPLRFKVRIEEKPRVVGKIFSARIESLGRTKNPFIMSSEFEKVKNSQAWFKGNVRIYGDKKNNICCETRGYVYDAKNRTGKILSRERIWSLLNIPESQKTEKDPDWMKKIQFEIED